MEQQFAREAVSSRSGALQVAAFPGIRLTEALVSEIGETGGLESAPP